MTAHITVTGTLLIFCIFTTGYTVHADDSEPGEEGDYCDVDDWYNSATESGAFLEDLTEEQLEVKSAVEGHIRNGETMYDCADLAEIHKLFSGEDDGEEEAGELDEGDGGKVQEVEGGKDETEKDIKDKEDEEVGLNQATDGGNEKEEEDGNNEEEESGNIEEEEGGNNEEEEGGNNEEEEGGNVEEEEEDNKDEQEQGGLGEEEEGASNDEGEEGGMGGNKEEDDKEDGGDIEDKEAENKEVKEKEDDGKDEEAEDEEAEEEEAKAEEDDASDVDNANKIEIEDKEVNEAVEVEDVGGANGADGDSDENIAAAVPDAEETADVLHDEEEDGEEGKSGDANGETGDNTIESNADAGKDQNIADVAEEDVNTIETAGDEEDVEEQDAIGEEEVVAEDSAENANETTSDANEDEEQEADNESITGGTSDIDGVAEADNDGVAEADNEEEDVEADENRRDMEEDNNVAETQVPDEIVSDEESGHVSSRGYTITQYEWICSEYYAYVQQEDCFGHTLCIYIMHLSYQCPSDATMNRDDESKRIKTVSLVGPASESTLEATDKSTQPRAAIMEGPLNDRIQQLEMQILRLENTILLERLSSTKGTADMSELTGMILKLENELLRLNSTLSVIQKDTDHMKNNHQSNAKELAMVKKDKGEYSITDNSIAEIITAQQNKIESLGKIMHEHLSDFSSVEEKAKRLEEDNRILVDRMLTQSMMMNDLMMRLDNITVEQRKQSETLEGLGTRIEHSGYYHTEREVSKVMDPKIKIGPVKQHEDNTVTEEMHKPLSKSEEVTQKDDKSMADASDAKTRDKIKMVSDAIPDEDKDAKPADAKQTPDTKKKKVPTATLR